MDVKPRWPSLRDLLYFGPRGVAMFTGTILVVWGLVWYWPPEASNARVMLGCAMVCWAECANYAWRPLIYRDSLERLRFAGREALGLVGWLIAGFLFFAAFETGAESRRTFDFQTAVAGSIAVEESLPGQSGQPISHSSQSTIL